MEEQKKENSLNNESIDKYKKFNDSIEKYENNPHYNELMCMKSTGRNIGLPKEKDRTYLESLNPYINNKGQKKLCVLPKGHKGKCSCNFNIFNSSSQSKKLKGSIETAIYNTPGNDDYVYKNRSSRLFEFALLKEDEKKIRDKTGTKKKCAIPLKDASTPQLQTQAYLDWLTFILNVEGISNILNTDYNGYEDIIKMINKNKEYLINHYKNRKIFNEEGLTICSITKEACKLEDFAEEGRDNRVDIKDTDIQLGHNEPRSESYVSIRGKNLLPQSRRGNLIIGEKKFTEDDWIYEMGDIWKKNASLKDKENLFKSLIKEFPEFEDIINHC